MYHYEFRRLSTTRTGSHVEIVPTDSFRESRLTTGKYRMIIYYSDGLELPISEVDLTDDHNIRIPSDIVPILSHPCHGLLALQRPVLYTTTNPYESEQALLLTAIAGFEIAQKCRVSPPSNVISAHQLNSHNAELYRTNNQGLWRRCLALIRELTISGFNIHPHKLLEAAQLPCHADPPTVRRITSEIEAAYPQFNYRALNRTDVISIIELLNSEIFSDPVPVEVECIQVEGICQESSTTAIVSPDGKVRIIIVIRKGLPESRIAYAILHEIGHYLLDFRPHIGSMNYDEDKSFMILPETLTRGSREASAKKFALFGLYPTAEIMNAFSEEARKGLITSSLNPAERRILEDKLPKLPLDVAEDPRWETTPISDYRSDFRSLRISTFAKWFRSFVLPKLSIGPWTAIPESIFREIIHVSCNDKIWCYADTDRVVREASASFATLVGYEIGTLCDGMTKIEDLLVDHAAKRFRREWCRREGVRSSVYFLEYRPLGAEQPLLAYVGAHPVLNSKGQFGGSLALVLPRNQASCGFLDLSLSDFVDQIATSSNSEQFAEIVKNQSTIEDLAFAINSIDLGAMFGEET